MYLKKLSFYERVNLKSSVCSFEMSESLMDGDKLFSLHPVLMRQTMGEAGYLLSGPSRL